MVPMLSLGLFETEQHSLAISQCDQHSQIGTLPASVNLNRVRGISVKCKNHEYHTIVNRESCEQHRESCTFPRP